MAYGVSSGIKIEGDKALFYIRLGTRPKNIPTLQKIWKDFFKPSTLDALEQLEFEKSLNKYLGRMMFRRLSSVNQGFYLGKSLYKDGSYRASEKGLEDIQSVTIKDIREVASKYLKDGPSLEIVVHAKR